MYPVTVATGCPAVPDGTGGVWGEDGEVADPVLCNLLQGGVRSQPAYLIWGSSHLLPTNREGRERSCDPGSNT